MAMSYEEFLDIAKDAAKARHPEAEVTIQKVEKLQGESSVGLSVRPEGQNAAVTMNLHELLDQAAGNPKRRFIIFHTERRRILIRISPSNH